MRRRSQVAGTGKRKRRTSAGACTGLPQQLLTTNLTAMRQPPRLLTTCKLFMSSRVQGILTTEEERSTHVLPPSCTRMHGVFWLLGAALPGSWGHGFKGAGKMRSKERVTTMQSTCITVSYRWMATRKAAGTALVPHSCDRNLGHFKVQSNMQLC